MSSTLVANNLLSSVTGNQVDLNLLASGGGAIIANDALIKEVVDPIEDQDAATKKYVDNTVAGGFTFTSISYAGVESNASDIGDSVPASEYTTYLDGNPFVAATVDTLLQGSRNYTQVDAALYAPIIVASFATPPTQAEWVARYQLRTRVDEQLLGVYATTVGASYDDVLFFNTKTNLARGWSPVTNLVLDQTGLNYKLMLAPGAKSYFTTDTQFFRRSMTDAFVRLSPNDFEVPGYIASSRVSISDLLVTPIITIPTIENGNQLTDFKVLCHYSDDDVTTDKWVAEFIIHISGGDLLIGHTSFENIGFATPVPFFLTAVLGGSGDIVISAQLNEGIARPNAAIISKVDVENVINPIAAP